MKSAVRKNYSVDSSEALIEGVRIGKIACLNKDLSVCVDFIGNKKKNLKARFVRSLDWNCLLTAAENQQELLLVFEGGNAGKPIIIDVLNSSLETSTESILEEQRLEFVDKDSRQGDELQDATVDGKRISFNAQDQIVLKCGKSSITLTKAGKVIIKGAYLLNRSSGALRIKGGSVQIN